MSDRYEAKAQERDTNPTPGVTSPSGTNESNPNALMSTRQKTLQEKLQ